MNAAISIMLITRAANVSNHASNADLFNIQTVTCCLSERQGRLIYIYIFNQQAEHFSNNLGKINTQSLYTIYRSQIYSQMLLTLLTSSVSLTGHGHKKKNSPILIGLSSSNVQYAYEKRSRL